MIGQFFYNHFFSFMAIISVILISVMISFMMILTKILNVMLDKFKNDEKSAN
jgi:hypothetical protein